MYMAGWFGLGWLGLVWGGEARRHHCTVSVCLALVDVGAR